MKEVRKYIIAVALLMGFVFNFAHSELDFLTPEGDTSHNDHDFCLLIKAGSTRIHVPAASFAQEAAKPLFLLLFILPALLITQGSGIRPFSALPSFRYTASETPRFLIFRTLLI